MTEPDRREQPDRRRLPLCRPTLGGRRQDDPDPSHGTRARYLRRCRCAPCKAANAKYWSAWRTLRKTGKLPLGASISAVEAQRLIRLLLKDWGSKAALAKELGKHHDLARLTQQDMITLRTALKVRRLYRTRVLEPRDETPAPPGSTSA